MLLAKTRSRSGVAELVNDGIYLRIRAEFDILQADHGCSDIVCIPISDVLDIIANHEEAEYDNGAYFVCVSPDSDTLNVSITEGNETIELGIGVTDRMMAE